MSEDLIKSDIRKSILALSWPNQIAFILQALFSLVDTIYIGRVSPDALAAVSMVFPVFVVMFSIAGGIGVGGTSLISRYLGSRKKKKALEVAHTTLLLSLLTTIFFMIIGFFYVEPLYTWMGAGSPVLEMAISYTKILLWGSVFMFVMIGAGSILRGEGDMKTPVKYMIISSIINVLLGPVLIYGLFGFPRMTVAGAAIALNISIAIGCFLTLLHVLRKKGKLHLSWKGFRYHGELAKKILDLGIPTSVAQSFLALGVIFLTKIAASFGPEAIAAYGVGYRLDLLAVLPALGITLTMVTIIGHNVGAKKFFRAIKAVINGSIIVAIEMGLIGLLLFLFPDLFMRIFTDNKEVIALGIDYLRIVGLTYSFIGVGMIIGAAFQGAGSSMPLLIITLARLVILPIPLAYLIATKIQENLSGLWTAIAISNVLSAILAVGWLLLSRFYQKALASEEGKTESFF